MAQQRSSMGDRAGVPAELRPSRPEPSYDPRPTAPPERVDEDPHFDLSPSDEFDPFEPEYPPQELTPEQSSPAPQDLPRSVAPPVAPREEQPAPSFERPETDNSFEFDADPSPPSAPNEPPPGDIEFDQPPNNTPDMDTEPADSDLDFDDLFLDENGSVRQKDVSGLAQAQMQSSGNQRPNQIRFKDAADRGDAEQVTVNSGLGVRRASHQQALRSTRPHASGQHLGWQGFRAISAAGRESSYQGQFRVDQNQEVIIEDLND